MSVSSTPSNIYIAIPAMDEAGLADSLLSLNGQTLKPRGVCVCINQPQGYHTDGIPEHKRICKVNETVYNQLRTLKQEGHFAFPFEVLDRFSFDKAWEDRHSGVGQARKTAMDFLSTQCDETSSSILVCMDADTVYPADYLQNLQNQFTTHPQAVAMANPYYHDIPDSLPEAHAIAMLHYECYMRAYVLQMMRTRHPYAFTAIGSSMACTLEAYRKIGGLTPAKSGEDFYFLQKLRKTGALLRHSASVSHPSCRLSTRVFFGTGPALNKGIDGNWTSYPFYPLALFEKMRDAYQALPRLFESGTPDPVLDFWEDAFGKDWWKKMRAHAGGRPQQFLRHCIEKFDALRSLQFLKASYTQNPESDWQNLCCLYRMLAAEFEDDKMKALCGNSGIHSLADLKLQDWKELRRYLFLCEEHGLRRQPLLEAF